MKKMKKLASILLAAIMVLAMAVPAMAADGGPLSGNTGNFKAYQIFKGTADDDNGSGILENIEWGDGVNVDTFIDKLKAAGITLDEEAAKKADGKDAYEWSKAIADASDPLVVAKAAAESVEESKGRALTVEKISEKNAYKVIAGIDEEGYYIIVDETNPEGAKLINLSLLQVSGFGDIEIAVKTDIPSVDKDVLDNDKQKDTTNLEGTLDGNNNDGLWGETADYNIGDEISFRLTAVIPDSVNLELYDAYKVVFHDTMSSSLTFKEIESVTINGSTAIPEKADGVNGYVPTTGEGTLTITIDDIKGLAGVNLSGKNEIVVTYKAVLNGNAVIGGKLGAADNNNDVYLEYSNNPNAEGTGNTEVDDVYVFTFKLEATKTDGETDEPLAGAEFALYKQADATTRKYAKLQNGKVTGWVDATADDAGNYTVPAEAGKVVTTAETNNITIEGLDADTYWLQETVTPDGYNTAEDTKVEIVAENNQEETLSGQGATVTVNQEPGELKIVNNKGAELPETGGIGTTIFYVLGSILVVGAVILLVTKKRMSVEK